VGLDQKDQEEKDVVVAIVKDAVAVIVKDVVAAIEDNKEKKENNKRI
jgi:hypothetical protein